VANQSLSVEKSKGGMHMIREMAFPAIFTLLLLTGGCSDKGESTAEKQPVVEQPAKPNAEEIDQQISERTDRAAEKAEQARARLEMIEKQARELAREAEVVGEEVNRVTSQVTDLNARLDQVAQMAEEVIDQARSALRQVEEARGNLRVRTDALLQAVESSRKAGPVPSEEDQREEESGAGS
jgi:uncharacterized coiled-coil DUF342 family protein